MHLFFLVVSVVCVRADKYFVELASPEVLLELLWASDDVLRVASAVESLVERRFRFGSFSAFVGNFLKEAVSHLSASPFVHAVLPDVEFRALDTYTQNNAPRHLARMSSWDALPLLGPYAYAYDSERLGHGVYAYVVDSGITTSLPEFQGRAVFGKDFTGEGPGDNNGHGTHVAGIVGLATYGVAKNITIVDVKALGEYGAGTLSSVVGALEYAVNHHLLLGAPGVVNLSLGAPTNDVLGRAIQATQELGLVVVCAAGNSNMDACRTSPANSPYAITVGAIDDTLDLIALFSNWGRCVDVFASGVYVVLLTPQDGVPRALSGTLMALPAVAGLVGALLSTGISLEEARSKVTEWAAWGQIPRRSMWFRRGTPNAIAHNDGELD